MRIRRLMMVLAGWAFFGTCGALASVDVDELLKRCAPSVHPETMRAVLSAESSGNVLAVADAGPVHLPWSQRKSMVRSHFPASSPEAIGLVKDLLKKGHTVSLGLAQINDRNLAQLGVSVESIFEPCANIAAGASILSTFYASAVKTYGPGPRALRAALSAYNSGSFVRGEQDGYVDLVFQKAGKPLVLKEGRASASVVPALSSAGEMPVGGWPSVTVATRSVAKASKGSSANRWRRDKDFTMLVSAFDEN